MSDCKFTYSSNPDPEFYREMLSNLIGLAIPIDYDTPEGRKILRNEVDKSIEQMEMDYSEILTKMYPKK